MYAVLCTTILNTQLISEYPKRHARISDVLTLGTNNTAIHRRRRRRRRSGSNRHYRNRSTICNKVINFYCILRRRFFIAFIVVYICFSILYMNKHIL